MDSIYFQAQTDTGKVRYNNEDRYFVAPWPSQQAILAVVADGMGGSSAGEVAAQIVVDVFEELLLQPFPVEPFQQYNALVDCCYKADTRIRQQSSTSFDLLGMGSTLVAAIITPKTCVHVHAGDSRLYHLRQQDIIYRTKDHSVIQVLLDNGNINPEDVATHPMRSMITSCLGGKNGAGKFSVDPKWHEENPPVIYLQPQDLLLLSSDGLHGFVADKDLAIISADHVDSVQKLTQALVDEALDGGGGDNITLVTVKII